MALANGARLRFAYLERDADADAYQGEAVARDKPNAAAVPPRHDAEAVMLDGNGSSLAPPAARRRAASRVRSPCRGAQLLCEKSRLLEGGEVVALSLARFCVAL